MKDNLKLYARTEFQRHIQSRELAILREKKGWNFMKFTSVTPRHCGPTVKQKARQECRSAKRGKAPISKTRSRSELASGIVRLADLKDPRDGISSAIRS